MSTVETVQVSAELIKQAHNEASSKWKGIIEKEFPQLFRNKPFPKLMISTLTGRIVLMTSERHGYVVVEPNNGGFVVGHSTSTWDMEKFKDFHGELKPSES